MRIVPILARCALVVAALLAASVPGRAQNDPLVAFENFVKDGQFDSASFYIQNGILKKEQIDTSQIFYDALTQKYSRDFDANFPKIRQIYDYLSQINPIDMNRVFFCGNNHESKCVMSTTVMSGIRPNYAAWFVERGLDLNQRVPDIVPATVPLIVRLGSYYSLNDLNWFAGNGLILGDETYPLQELANYRDSYISGGGLNLPGNYLSLNDQNFLDMLVIVLGSTVLRRHDSAEVSRRRSIMCDFITYAAPSYKPSFDYLSYLLGTVQEFRGVNVGKQAKDGRLIYQPFPNSCVTLIENMAVSHAQLSNVISSFAADSDVATANWLISIAQRRSQGG
ncbi:hypothetical protein [Oricola nitratireducens]|jgi:hypothetical protein|uniref:hypothetical protein n=1 Tax=Oricola nitratireducens TaxID=2775868 RepID=UPI0018696951|nr:hypothetical protein [Oricola nitratireducens]